MYSTFIRKVSLKILFELFFVNKNFAGILLNIRLITDFQVKNKYFFKVKVFNYTDTNISLNRIRRIALKSSMYSRLLSKLRCYSLETI